MEKQFNSVQEILDNIDSECAEKFRCYQRRPLVRLRRWWRWIYTWFTVLFDKRMVMRVNYRELKENQNRYQM